MTLLITGGAQGIGRAATERALAQAQRVVVLDKDISALQRASSPDLSLVEGDVTDVEAISHACSEAGEITGVVACAGISRPGASDTYPSADWAQIIAINLGAVFETFRLAHRTAVPGASFIAISSISGMQGFSGRAAYGASKAGVEGLVRSLAVEYAPNVRVNAIAPGYILTDLVRRNIESGAIAVDQLISRTPMARLGTPGDIADSIGFLLSPASSWITGATLVVDGGCTSFGLGLGEQ